MIRFETLLEKVRSYSPEADLELLRRAYVFSALEHKGQVRHSGEPYLVHPLEVADFLADMKLDVVAVAAGLLHDVVEDTLTTPERIAELFGAEIAHVVEGVTKIGAIPFSSSEERQAENFRKMLLAMVDDIRVILVKLADRLHNMRTLHHLPEERRIKIAQETLDIYAPIANRLGMSKVKNELEELVVQVSRAEGLRGAAGRRSRRSARAAEAVADDLTRTLAAKLDEAQVPVIRLDGRIKRLYSIHLKLKRQKIDLERVYDFVALRVITQSVKDCYAALGIIHQTWSPVPGRIKDFIAMPRPNGYQSLHTSVISEHGFPFEVQIRTEEMHRRAEEGIAAHWKYKEGRVGDQRDERYFQWMRQLLEVQQEVRDPQEFLQNLKIDLYPEEVYIFTPKGEVRSLPRGATAVDFAYSIHTDVGNQCVGARINGKMVPLRTPAAERRHRRDRHAGRAQAEPRLAGVRRHLAGAQQDQARAAGRGARPQHRARTPAVREGGAPLRPEPEDGAREPRARRSSPSEYGAQQRRRAAGPHRLRQALGAHGAAEGGPPARAEGEGARLRRRLGRQARAAARRASADKIKVRGTDDVMVFRAKCCNPIRGERIVGYITRGKGVSVHAASCSERHQPDVRSRAAHRRRMGQRRRRSGRLHRAADDAGRGSEGHAGRDQREGLRHQHQHHQHGSAHRRRSAGAHRHDRRDQGREAPREGDQVDQGRAGRAGRRAHGAGVGAEPVTVPALCL